MPEKLPVLTEAKIIMIVHAQMLRQFPKICLRCNRYFPTYRDYLLNTKPIGDPVSYDLDFGEIKPAQSTGNVSLANCTCGNTLTLSSHDMPSADLWVTLKWVSVEVERRKSTVLQVLKYLREAVQNHELSKGA
jgi:hypothetical protein